MYVLPLFDSQDLAASLDQPLAMADIHTFPDGETKVHIQTRLQGETVFILTSLNQPNEKTLPLLFVAEALRSAGVKAIHLIAPYLAYMRQDKAFHPGEGISAQYYAKLLSMYFDSLFTIDPHLHRVHQLSEIYTIPTTVWHATLPIAEWIKTHIKHPVLIGPDGESEQWVSEVASHIKAPYIIATKTRLGDARVSVNLSLDKAVSDHTPVLVDDIIASGQTMIENIHDLMRAGWAAPVCIGVHALFSQEVLQHMLEAGASDVITCNTIPHSTNRITIAPLIKSFLEAYR